MKPNRRPSVCTREPNKLTVSVQQISSFIHCHWRKQRSCVTPSWFPCSVVLFTKLSSSVIAHLSTRCPLMLVEVLLLRSHERKESHISERETPKWPKCDISFIWKQNQLLFVLLSFILSFCSKDCHIPTGVAQNKLHAEYQSAMQLLEMLITCFTVA